MLIVSRLVEETIVAGPVTFKLLGIRKGGRIVIGIEAPPEVPILRGELVGTEKAAEARSANRDTAA